jgi:hypothetical protein
MGLYIDELDKIASREWAGQITQTRPSNWITVASLNLDLMVTSNRHDMPKFTVSGNRPGKMRGFESLISLLMA